MANYPLIAENGRTIYFIVVSGIALTAILLIRRWLRKKELHRKKHIKNVSRFEAVGTKTPLEDPTAKAYERGVESIETRFSAIQRLLLPMLVAIWAFATGFPFLRQLPAVAMSFVFGTLTVVIGIAARPFIENVIAGLVVSFSQPIRIGDTVRIDGNYGTIEDISLTFTVIKLWDWRRYIVPNYRMLQKEYLNYSIIDRYIWAHVEFWVSYESDINLVRKLALESVELSENFAPYEPPAFWVMEMDKLGYRCWAAGWTENAPSAWMLGHDVRTELVSRFAENGIKCHMYNHELS